MPASTEKWLPTISPRPALGGGVDLGSRAGVGRDAACPAGSRPCAGTRKTSEPFFACPTRSAIADREKVDSGGGVCHGRRYRHCTARGRCGGFLPRGRVVGCGGRLSGRPSAPRGTAIVRRVSPSSPGGGYQMGHDLQRERARRGASATESGRRSRSHARSGCATLAPPLGADSPQNALSGLSQSEGKPARSHIPPRSGPWRQSLRQPSHAGQLRASAHHLERSGQHHCPSWAASSRSRRGRAVGVRRFSQ